MTRTSVEKTQTRRSTGKQAIKSEITRTATLDAAIDCFVELGYSESSTERIASRAGITRGAMLHHFPVKRDLLNAVVNYINKKRIGSFGRAIRRLRNETDRNKRGLDVYWRSLHTDLYIAYAELRTAARTDRELNSVMRKATKDFDDRWLQLIEELYPEWTHSDELIRFAIDLVQFAMEGMASNRLSHDVKARQLSMRDFLNAIDADILAISNGAKECTQVSKFLIQLMRNGKNL